MKSYEIFRESVNVYDKRLPSTVCSSSSPRVDVALAEHTYIYLYGACQWEHRKWSSILGDGRCDLCLSDDFV